MPPRGLVFSPTQTRFGWHVIEVQDVRRAPFPPFEQVREKIAQELTQKRTAVSTQAMTRGPTLRRETCSILEYPPSAIRNNETGKVRLRYAVNSDGRVVKTEVAESSGSSVLDLATQRWLESCAFLPALENGRPVDSSAQIEYVWKIAP